MLILTKAIATIDIEENIKYKKMKKTNIITIIITVAIAAFFIFVFSSEKAATMFGFKASGRLIQIMGEKNVATDQSLKRGKVSQVELTQDGYVMVVTEERELHGNEYWGNLWGHLLDQEGNSQINDFRITNPPLENILELEDLARIPRTDIFVVTWKEQSSLNPDWPSQSVKYRLFNIQGNMLTEETFITDQHNNPPEYGFWEDEPRIMVNPDGNYFRIIWSNVPDQSPNQPFASVLRWREYNKQGEPSGEISNMLTPEFSGDNFYNLHPDLISDQTGNVYLTWIHGEGDFGSGNQHLYGKIMEWNGNTIISETKLANTWSNMTSTNGETRISLTADDNLYFMWGRPYAGRIHIQGQIFDKRLVPKTEEVNIDGGMAKSLHFVAEPSASLKEILFMWHQPEDADPSLGEIKARPMDQKGQRGRMTTIGSHLYPFGSIGTGDIISLPNRNYLIFYTRNTMHYSQVFMTKWTANQEQIISPQTNEK